MAALETERVSRKQLGARMLAESRRRLELQEGSAPDLLETLLHLERVLGGEALGGVAEIVPLVLDRALASRQRQQVVFVIEGLHTLASRLKVGRFAVGNDALRNSVLRLVVDLAARDEVVGTSKKLFEALEFPKGSIAEIAGDGIRKALGEKNTLWVCRLVSAGLVPDTALELSSTERSLAGDMVAEVAELRMDTLLEPVIRVLDYKPIDPLPGRVVRLVQRAVNGISSSSCRCEECRATAASLRRTVELLTGLSEPELGPLLGRLAERALSGRVIPEAVALGGALGSSVTTLFDGALGRLALGVFEHLLARGDAKSARALADAYRLKSFAPQEFRSACAAALPQALRKHDLSFASEVSRLLELGKAELLTLCRPVAERMCAEGNFAQLTLLVDAGFADAPSLAPRVRSSLFDGFTKAGWPSSNVLERLVVLFGIRPQLFRARGARVAAENRLGIVLAEGNLTEASGLMARFKLPVPSHAGAAVAASFLTLVERGELKDAAAFARHMANVTLDATDRGKMMARACGALVAAAHANDLELVSVLRRVFEIKPEQYGPEVAEAVVCVTNQHRCQGGRILSQALDFPVDSAFPQGAQLNQFYHQLVERLQLRTFAELFSFVAENQNYCNWLAENGRSTGLNAAMVRLLRSPQNSAGFPLTLAQADLLAQRDRAFVERLTRSDYAGVCEVLFDLYARSRSRPALEQVTAEFGPREMLEYLYRPRHPGVIEFETCVMGVAALRGESGLSYQELRHRVLDQVRRDGAAYERRAPQEELARIVRGGIAHRQAILEDARRRPEIAPLVELARSFAEGNSPFASWDSLKRWGKLAEAVESPGFLDGLESLRARSPQLYRYVCDLYFHVASRVSGEAIRQFATEIDAFLQRPDSHMPRALSDAIRVSRLTDGTVPFLDLTGNALREALVGGALDALQAFHPLEISYQVPRSGRRYPDIGSVLRTAIGESDKGISGIAARPGVVFKRVKDELSSAGLSLRDVLAPRADIDAALKERLLGIVFDPADGISEEWVTVTATLHRKSSAAVFRIGDDTASCMPFGEGKTNNYAFDPNTCHFTVTVSRGDGASRTIAQSVLTRDQPLSQSFYPMLTAMKDGRTDLTKLLKSPLALHGPFELTCDNLQVAPNVDGDPFYESLIPQVYEDFFGEYMRRFAGEEKLNPSKVSIGKNSSGAIESFAVGPNRSIPLTAPIGYCDRNSDEVCMLSPADGPRFVHRVVKDLAPGHQVGVPTAHAGFAPLEPTDVLPLAVLRGESRKIAALPFSGVQGARRGLQAIAISNAVRGRPNLSVRFLGDNGVMQGALLAFETTLRGFGAPAIYVQQLLSLRPDQCIGPRLVSEFLRSYLRAYRDGERPPVYVDVRSSDCRALSLMTKRVGRVCGREVHVERVPRDLGFRRKEPSAAHSGNRDLPVAEMNCYRIRIT